MPLAALFFFARNILGYIKMSPNLHGYMCRELERDHLRLVMEIPRAHYKTSIASVSAPMAGGLCRLLTRTSG